MRDVSSVALEQVVIVYPVNPALHLQRMSPSTDGRSDNDQRERFARDQYLRARIAPLLADLSYTALLKCDARQSK